MVSRSALVGVVALVLAVVPSVALANNSTFTPISNYAGLSPDLRRQLTETKIEPTAEGPAPPPPVRQVDATSARSTKNKQAQADR